MFLELQPDRAPFGVTPDTRSRAEHDRIAKVNKL